MNSIYQSNTERLDLEPMYRGDDWAIKVELVDDDELPLDLNGFVFTLTLKLSEHQADSEAALISIGEYKAPDPDTKTVYIISSSEQTSLLLPTVYRYDIQADYFGSISTIASGRLRVIGDITRGNFSV